jgi:outer membrane protein OmpA-like peptidoglycan-associated protein
MADKQEQEAAHGHGEGGGGGHGGGGHGGGGHGGGGSHEEHEGAPEWLISFADNVALMMGFFVILLALNMKPASSGSGAEGAAGGTPQAAKASPDILDFSIAVRKAFNNPVDPNSTDPIDLPLVRRLLERNGDSAANQPGPEGYEHDVKSIRPTDYYGSGGTVPFNDDSSTLDEAGAKAVTQVAEQLRGHRLVLEVRGHVSLAEAVRHEPRGMQLAYDRAVAVANALVAQGVEWRQIRLIACGDADPIVTDAYDETRHRPNQRVEVVTTDRVVHD